MAKKFHYLTSHFVACGRRNTVAILATTTYVRVDCQACRNEIDKQADGGAQWAQRLRGH